MKIYHAVAVAALVTPALGQAGPPPGPRLPPLVSRSVLPAGPVMGTGVNPGVAPGPAPGTVINPGGGIVPGPGPVMGTIINPGSGGRPGGWPGHGEHRPAPPSTEPTDGH
jgi:hypothetical protein